MPVDARICIQTSLPTSIKLPIRTTGCGSAPTGSGGRAWAAAIDTPTKSKRTLTSATCVNRFMVVSSIVCFCPTSVHHAPYEAAQHAPTDAPRKILLLLSYRDIQIRYKE